MLKKYGSEAYERFQAHSLLIGWLGAVLMTVAALASNLMGGPLYNLNDIHTWQNRMIFTGMATFMHFSLMAILVLDSHKDIGHLLVRELIVTVSLMILFLAMNQKTFAYNSQIQPIVRAMDTRALSAIPDFRSGHSVPALTLYYLLTRGPIYDMYLAKLFCMGCYELLCISAAHIARELPELAQRNRWLPECAMALALILPQGFLSAACAAQIEVAGILLAVLAFILLERGKKTGLVLFGVGASICTGLWLLVPIAILYAEKWELKVSDILMPLAAALICCVPGAITGSGWEAFFSLFACLKEIPIAGSGVPALVSFFPRAVLEEIPEYANLRALPELDLMTFAAENYKASHYEILMHGLSFACLAVYMGMTAYVIREKRKDKVTCILSLILIAFVCAPCLTMGAWQLVTVLCMFILVYIPELRIPGGVVLFVTAGGCGYPVTGEIMIKPVYIALLSLMAIGMLLGFWPGKGKKNGIQERVC